jgi:hypothetical protein
MDKCSPASPQRDTMSHSKRAGCGVLMSFARMATTKPLDLLASVQPDSVWDVMPPIDALRT